MKEPRSISRLISLPLILCGMVCLVSVPDLLGIVDWKPFALRPRDWSQWYGILTAPLLHGSWEHLWSNLPPLFFLALGVRLFYPEVERPVLIASYVTPGLWTFFIASGGLHLGASGVVYALAFFLFFSGVFRKDVRALALTLVVAMFYGSMVWGVFPGQPGISWESHLSGALAGIILAWFYRKKGPPRKKYSWEEEEDRPEDTGPWDYKKWTVPPEGFEHPG